MWYDEGLLRVEFDMYRQRGKVQVWHAVDQLTKYSKTHCMGCGRLGRRQVHGTEMRTICHDCIQKHREVAQLRFTADKEILALYHPIEAQKIKSRFNDWRFIMLHNHVTQHGQVLLVGTIEAGISRVTGVVRKVDLDRNLVFTNSGYLYQFGTPGQGEPPFEDLATICWAFHSWGFGQALGVPECFY